MPPQGGEPVGKLQAGPLPLLRAGRRRVPAVGVCQQSEDRHQQMTLRLGQRGGLLDLVRAAATQLLAQQRSDMGVWRVVMPGQLATDVDVPRQRAGQRRQRDLRWQEAAVRAQTFVISLARNLCEPQGIRGSSPDVGRHGSRGSGF